MSTTTWVALSLMALAILTMPIYAVMARRRPVDADVARRPTTIILGTWVRDWLMWIIGPVERKFVEWKLSPDIFNYVGGAFGLFAGIAFANNELALGGWLILFGGLVGHFRWSHRARARDRLELRRVSRLDARPIRGDVRRSSGSRSTSSQRGGR